LVSSIFEYDGASIWDSKHNSRYFTAYFGSGKSRIVGGILIAIGILVFVIFMWGAGWLEGMLGAPQEGGMLYFKDTILQGVIAILGAIVGAAVALGIFLMAIMKA